MKFESSPIREHEEVPLADDGKWEDIVKSWSRRDPRARSLAVSEFSDSEDSSENNIENGSQNKSYVVSIALGANEPNEARLAELTSLVRSQGDLVVGNRDYFAAEAKLSHAPW